MLSIGNCVLWEFPEKQGHCFLGQLAQRWPTTGMLPVGAPGCQMKTVRDNGGYFPGKPNPGEERLAELNACLASFLSSCLPFPSFLCEREQNTARDNACKPVNPGHYHDSPAWRSPAW